VISIRRHAPQFTRRDRPHLWSTVVALVLSAASFAGVMRSLSQVVASVGAPSPYTPDATPERITFVTPHVAPTVLAPTIAPSIPTAPTVPRGTGEVARPVAPRPDSSFALPASPSVTPNYTEPRSPFEVPAPFARLLPPGSGSASPFAPRSVRDPSAPAAPPSAAERDSTLAALGNSFAELVARRVPTRSERDSTVKAAMLKMHNTGRILLVPPDNSGGLVTAAIPLPFLGPGQSNARRVRDRAVHDENRARLERLRQRADSMRRARDDSLAK
jgi:hypothetical protein